MKRHGLTESGYTLFEMLLVLGVILLAGLIIVPNFAGLITAWDLEGETRKMAAEIREIQQVAVMNQNNYGVRISSGDVACYDVGTYDEVAKMFNLQTADICLDKGILIDGMWWGSGFPEIENNPYVFYFDHLGSLVYIAQSGSIVYGSSAMVDLKDNRGNSLKIDIEGETGKIRLR